MLPDPSATSPWPARRYGVALAAVLAVGLLARLLYLSQFAAFPFFDHPVGDSAAHLKRAGEIAAGHLLPDRPLYYCSIFYPYFLAGTLALFRGSLVAVSVLQILAGLAVVALIADAARRLYGPAAGIAAAALAALYGPAAYFEADILGVVGGQLALALLIWALVAWRGRASATTHVGAGRLALAGLALGLAAVERPNLLVLVAPVALWCATLAGWRRAHAALAPLAAGVALPLAVVLALNLAGTGQWVPLTTSAGINLSLSYHEGATGVFEEPWERSASHFAATHTEPEEAMVTRASAEVGHALTPQQASDYWRARALEYIRAHPGAAVRLTLRKALLLLNAGEVPNHLDFEFMRERAPALWLMPVGFGAVLALAMLGFGLARHSGAPRGGSWLIALIAAGTWASVVPFTVADRYRAPLAIPLLVGAGAGLAGLLRLARDPGARRERGLALALGLALVAALVSALPLVRPLRGRDYWMFAQSYEARGDLRAARREYEAAVRAEATDGELLNNLGSICRTLGDRAAAEAWFRRAIAADSGLAFPHKNLGLVLAARGANDEALAELSAALRIAPEDPGALGMVGALLAERGDRAGADAAFARALKLAPDDARLQRLIAHYGARRDAKSVAGR